MSSFNHPNFVKKREKLIQVEFVPVKNVFKAMVQVRAMRDVSGWVDVRKRTKWAMKKDCLYMLDEDKAREFITKGYVEHVQGDYKPVSEMERDEMLSTVTNLYTGNSLSTNG